MKNNMILTIKFKRHLEVKDTLLEMIASTPSGNILEGQDKIQNTDWHHSGGQPQAYWNFVGPIIFQELEPIITEKLLPDSWSIKNAWFQQYETKDTHSWHVHPGSFWNAVYYIELPEDGPSTQMQMPITREVITPQVTEGDIIIFPAVYRHRSAPNESKKRKTIISFNINANEVVSRSSAGW